MPSATATAASSPRCITFFSFRGSPGEQPRVRHGRPAAPGCGKIDRVASWVGNGVAAAFFASLERCSCINIATYDDGEDANGVPLIRDDGNARRDSREWGAGAARRRRDKGKKRGSLFEDFTDDKY